jgi:hypothetical protein
MLKSPRFSRRVSVVRWRLVRRFLFKRLRLRGALSPDLHCLGAKLRCLLAPRTEIADRWMTLDASPSLDCTIRVRCAASVCRAA